MRRLAVTRLLADGSTDPGYPSGPVVLPGVGAMPSLGSAVLDEQGRLVVFGTDATSAFVARLTAAGAPDPTFDGDGVARVLVARGTPENAFLFTGVADADGIVAVGYTADQGAVEGLAVRLTPGGGLDPSFNGTGIVYGGSIVASGLRVLYDVVRQPNGRYLVGGQGRVDLRDSALIGRLTATGQWDADLNGSGWRIEQPTGNSYGGSALVKLALTGDGGVLGATSEQFGETAGSLPLNAAGTLRLGSSSAPVAGYGHQGAGYTIDLPGGDASVPAGATALLQQPDGKAVVLGGTTDASTQLFAVRLSADGIRDPRFGPRIPFGVGDAGRVGMVVGLPGFPVSTAAGAILDGGWALVGTTVTLPDGRTSAGLVRIRLDRAPTVELSGPSALAPGQAAGFSASVADPDGNDELDGVRWDLGDGTTATGPSVEHAFAAPGSYDVRVTAKDRFGLETTARQTVVVAVPGSGGGGAGGGGGGAGGGGGGGALAPRITKLRISPSTFRPLAKGRQAFTAATKRKRGATVRFTASTRARTTWVVQREVRGVRKGTRCVAPPKRGKATGKRCTRLVAVTRFARTEKAGAGRFRLTGRARGKALKPGRYRLRATPAKGRAVSARFRVVR